MVEYQQFWLMKGLFLDKNNDGVIDGISLYIDFPDQIMPEGLFDFVARLGFETTALSFHLFEDINQNIRLSFQLSNEDTFSIINEKEACIYYQTEISCSNMLRELAQAGLEINNLKDIPMESRLIEKVTDIWSVSGFGECIEASPNHHLSLGINIDSSIKSPLLFKEICYLVERAALYSTSIELPLTLKNNPSILFDFKESKVHQITVPTKQHILLEGTQDGIVKLLNWLNRQKHWRNGGSFGEWEQKLILEQKQESTLWFEQQWSTKSEVEKLYEILSENEIGNGTDIEIFISEPLDIRKNIELLIKETYPFLKSVKVRSSFKPGFHWIREEILPLVLKKCSRLKILCKKEVHEDGLELPIRWIQELYPVDRLIEEEIGLSANDIEFFLMEDGLKTYEVIEVMENGEEKTLGELSVPVSKVPYVLPTQYSYPTSNMVRISVDEKVRKEIEFKTDREEFYLYYLENVLPKLTNELNEIKEGQGVSRPLFARIEIEVTMSEEEEKLVVDHERTSSMEALYEDLYFNTLEYFREWGYQKTGVPFDAPGGIHPFMHIRKGCRPNAKIKVYKWDDYLPKYFETTKVFFIPEIGDFQAIVQADSFYRKIQLGDHSLLPTSSRNFLATGLVHHPAINVMFPATSYGGEPIPIIEVFLPNAEEYESSLKMSLYKPTIVIEAGHHSNEVSSTPAAIQLLQEIVQGEIANLKNINIIIIPMANPDGTKLLAKLKCEHPEWKHHAARYNAVGLEFAHIRYQQTIFGEADVLPMIMKKWAPDIVVDNHGIPAHEWIQPFAGYNSPPLFPVSYFLPSAKMYGIGRVSQEVNTDLLLENLEKIVLSISGQFVGTAIEEKNLYWKNRFTKYGHQWLPDIFPLEEADNFTFYRGTAVTPTYPTVSILRFPEWVAADLISEAADEIVYGDELESSVDAQVLFNKGIIEVLQKKKPKVITSHLVRYRERPIRL